MDTQHHNDDYKPPEVIKKLTDILEQPERFAQLFCDAANKQKSIDEALKNLFKNLLRTDYETRGYIREMIREIEKEDWKTWLKRFGTLIYMGISFLSGVIITAIVTRFIHP